MMRGLSCLESGDWSHLQDTRTQGIAALEKASDHAESATLPDENRGTFV